jgi:mitochondrial chaperone BCS1
MDSIWELLTKQFASNQFFSGGLILMLSGAALAVARHVPGKVWQWIKDRCLTEIDIPDREPAFEWLDKWLAAHAYSQKRARRLTVRVQQPDHGQRAAEPGGDHRPRILFSPAPGEHWLWYRGRLVILNRQRADAEKNAQGQGPLAIRETFTITIVSRDRRLAWKLLEEAREHVLPRGEQRLTIYHTAYCTWSEQMKRLPRPPESVILQEGVMEDLIDDVRRFLSGREWYLRRGIPYRRGYLLYGPPGTGKSSAVVAIASALGMDIAVLNLNSSSLDDNELTDRLADVPPNAMVLIEDIDCAFVARKAGEEKTNRVTFSGLLNALDGVAAGEGRILFATTNHPERLDPALVRPGRIDRKLHIGLADAQQVRRIYQRFFPAASERWVESFVAGIPEEQIAMSALQTYLIRHAASAEEAATCTDELPDDGSQPATAMIDRTRAPGIDVPEDWPAAHL